MKGLSSDSCPQLRRLPGEASAPPALPPPLHAAWLPCREVSLNWLAFGLLLTAWNAADGDAAEFRPEALRHHPQVSVRAAQRAWNP